MNRTHIKELRTEMALDDWKYDRWGTAMDWHFRIADILNCRGDEVPTHWEYQAGILGSDDHEGDILHLFDSATLTHVGNILSRYTRLCDRAGLSY